MDLFIDKIKIFRAVIIDLLPLLVHIGPFYLELLIDSKNRFIEIN